MNVTEDSKIALREAKVFRDYVNNDRHYFQRI